MRDFVQVVGEVRESADEEALLGQERVITA
jgi:hypothetical protein